jgi:hypothetical protein
VALKVGDGAEEDVTNELWVVMVEQNGMEVFVEYIS